MITKRDKENKILNKHFIGMVAIFVIVIVTVLTFVSFVEEALHKDITLNKNKITKYQK